MCDHTNHCLYIYRGANSVTTPCIYIQEMKVLPTLFTFLYNTENKYCRAQNFLSCIYTGEKITLTYFEVVQMLMKRRSHSNVNSDMRGA